MGKNKVIFCFVLFPNFNNKLVLPAIEINTMKLNDIVYITTAANIEFLFANHSIYIPYFGLRASNGTPVAIISVETDSYMFS